MRDYERTSVPCRRSWTECSADALPLSSVWHAASSWTAQVLQQESALARISSGAGRGIRSGRGVAALVVVVLAAAIALAALLGSGGDRGGLSRRQVLTYQEKLSPLAKEWGRIEVQGMRPAIADLRSGEGVPAEMIAGEASAWEAGLKGLRVKIQNIQAPGSLARASVLFDQAIVRYIAAAVTFERAAQATGDERIKGIEDGVNVAIDGARIYNEASLTLQAARRKVGLGPTTDFPDKPAAG
jgi:hypothetical protein